MNIAVSLMLTAVLFSQRTALPEWGLPLSVEARPASLTQRDNGAPSCEGLVEESGDPDKLPPWAMGWLMPKGDFVSVYRFSTLQQAMKCAEGKDYSIRRWDRVSKTWKRA